MRLGSTAAVLIVLGLCPPLASSDEAVLHERVFFGGMRCRGGVCTSDGEIRAVEQDGRLLPAPGDGPTPAPGEQVFSPEPEHAPPPPPPGGPPLPGDPSPERRPIVRMDRDTGPEAPIAHAYHAVFTPSEFPYKRTSVLDWANDDESLQVFDPARRPVERLGPEARRPDHDAFWGSVVVDLQPDAWIPLPSIAPEQRLIDFHTDPPSPPSALEFSRDGADNFFVRARAGGGAIGRRRLIWLLDAPQQYFAGPIPESLLDEEPRLLLRPLPQRVRQVALGVLDALAIPIVPHAPLRAVLDPLVAYFRAFESGVLPSPSSSTYRDLALGKRGVCRHRAYAFTITALAAGIPTRYVENELHVFVEVYLPRLGWRRVNLGGAALDDRLASGDGKPVHRPRGEDPLPRPAEYLASSVPPDRRRTGGSGRGVGSGEGRSPAIDLRATLEADAKLVTAEPARRRTSVSLVVDDRVAYRGDTVELSGRVAEADGSAAADLVVELYLDGSPGAELLAQTRSGPDGRFVVLALVPPALQLGAYSVVARIPGDASHLPSSSRRR